MGCSADSEVTSTVATVGMSKRSAPAAATWVPVEPAGMMCFLSMATSSKRLQGHLSPRGFEELENPVGRDGSPVRAIVELVPQLVASLFELEDGAHPRQLLGRGGYELHRAVPYRRLVALEEGAARVSLPRREAPKRLSALFRRTPPRRSVHRIAERAQHSGDIAHGRVLADALLE